MLDSSQVCKARVKTPHLTACTTTREEWRWPEDEALVAWADGTDADLVRVKRSPDKAAIKSYVKESGDCPDGLEIVPVESVRMDVG